MLWQPLILHDQDADSGKNIKDDLPVDFHGVLEWWLGTLDIVGDAGNSTVSNPFPVSLHLHRRVSFLLASLLKIRGTDGWCLEALLPNRLAHSTPQRFSERLEYSLLIVSVDDHIYDRV